MRYRWFCIANANFYKFYRDTLWSYEQKRLNRSICRLGCGLGWAKGSTSSLVFVMWRQWEHVQSYLPGGANVPSWGHWRHLANTNEPPVCCGDAALWHNVKLLGPLLIRLHMLQILIFTVGPPHLHVCLLLVCLYIFICSVILILVSYLN